MKKFDAPGHLKPVGIITVRGTYLPNKTFTDFADFSIEYYRIFRLNGYLMNNVGRYNTLHRRLKALNKNVSST